MANIPGIQLTVSSSGLGIILPGGAELPANIAGWCSNGPAGVPAAQQAGVPTEFGAGATAALQASFGIGEAVDLACSCLTQGASGVFVTRIYHGSLGSTTHTGSGAGTVTFSATQSGGGPVAPYGTPTATGSTGIIIQIVASGGVGVGTFNWSLDGGNTYSVAQTIPAAPGIFAIPTTGVTVTFNNNSGSFVATDTYVAPITTATGSSGSVTHLGPNGGATGAGGQVSADAANNPQDSYNVIVMITATGIAGVGQYSYSIDGGLTWSPNIQIPSSNPSSLGAGILIDWTNEGTEASITIPSTTGGDGITWTAVADGAQYNSITFVQNAPSGGSSTAAITGTFPNLTITISPASAATNSSLLSAISSTLSAYVTGAATGGSDTVIAFTAANMTGGVNSGFAAGDTYSFQTTGPAYTAGDVIQVTDNLQSESGWDWIHFAGRPSSVSASVSLFGTLSTQMSAWFAAQLYSFAVMETPVDTTTQNIDAALVSGFANATSDYVSVGAGDCAIVSPVSGSSVQRNAAWAATIQGSISAIGQDLKAVNAGPLPFIQTLYRDENKTPGLDTAGFTTLRTWNQIPGFFLTNARIKCSTQSNIQYWQSRRVLNAACRAAYQALAQYVGDDLPVSTTSGFLDAATATAIANFVRRAILNEITGQASGVSVVVSTTNDILATETLEATIGVVPKAYPAYVQATIGYTNPALSSQS